VRKVGLEPTRLAAQEPKSSASAISPLPRALKSLAHDVDNFSPVLKSGAKVFSKGAKMTLIQAVADKARQFLITDEFENSADAVAGVIDQLALGSGLVLDDEADLRAQAIGRLDGFGAIDSYLADASIEEIWINRPNELFAAKRTGVERISLDLPEDQIRTLVHKMLRNSGRRIDRSSPFVDASLPDGSRLHVVIPDVTSKYWSLNIRKFPSKLLSLEQLVTNGSLRVEQAQFLAEAVVSGQNILISGATNSGKTTLLCALLNELGSDTRLVSCEETFEIRSNLADWVAMQTRQPNLEGRGEVPLRRLVKEALRMRPGYLAIGEVREAESLDLLIGMNSGIPGICTIHANSAAAALTKLCTLPLLAGPNISAEFVSATATQAIDLVVQCSNDAARGRWVSAIAKVRADSTGHPVVEELTF
jgi:pilus assembly protein CpaF